MSNAHPPPLDDMSQNCSATDPSGCVSVYMPSPSASPPSRIALHDAAGLALEPRGAGAGAAGTLNFPQLRDEDPTPKPAGDKAAEAPPVFLFYNKITNQSQFDHPADAYFRRMPVVILQSTFLD